MQKNPERYWDTMATDRIEASDTFSWIAVFPVSATEQHGPHLPISTDRIIGEKMVETVVSILPDDLPVTFLPMQSIGQSVEHASFSGTLTSDWSTIIPLWIDIGRSVANAGVKKVIIINSHGGNSALVDLVTLELRRRFKILAVGTSWMRFGAPEGLFEDDEWRLGIHGGDVETSLMLHFRPDLVDMAKAGQFPSSQLEFERRFTHLRAHGAVSFGWLTEDLNRAGAIGNASFANASKGKALAAYQAERFVELCQDVNAFKLEMLA